MQGLVSAKPHESCEDVITRLESVKTEFAQLVDEHGDEERAFIQPYLEKHPEILAPAAEVIPQQKLGIELVTDFVICYPGDQGVAYALVEIEPATLPIFKKPKKGKKPETADLSQDFNHALEQTINWDSWLETNKSYLRNHLPGFETPQYVVICGRSQDLNDTQKAELRACERRWHNTIVRSYDDLLAGLEQHIKGLKRIQQGIGDA